jgi:acyl-coenzyme A synthetase/AMP-(fatty) acid ligase
MTASDRAPYASWRPPGSLVSFGEQPRTWRDLLADAARVKAVLDRSDVAGREVLVACTDRYHLAACLLGLWSAGGSAALPPNNRPETLEAIRAAAGAPLVLGEDVAGGIDVRPLLALPREETAEDASSLRVVSHSLATVYSSGSTGRHVACRKSQRQLLGEAELLARTFVIGPDARVVGMASANHIYGLLVGVLMPLLSGAAFHRSPPLQGAAVAAALTHFQANVLCGVPVQLASLLALQAGELPSSLQIFSSGAALPDETSTPLTERFGARVVELFGSSETGGIAWRLGGSRSPWTPLEGVVVTADQEGRILVDSPFLDPDAPHPYRGGDRVACLPDGRFLHLGRADGIVKVAGARVSVVEVEDRLKSVAGVLDAVVVAVQTETSRQNELWAAVVAPGITTKVIRSELLKRLDPVALPRRFRFLDCLPREETGKLPRSRVMALFDDGLA